MKKNATKKTDGKNDQGKKEVQDLELRSETKQGAIAIFLIILGVFFILAKFEIAGPAGKFSYSILSNLFGTGYLLFPLVFLIFAISLLKYIKPTDVLTGAIFSGIFFFFSSLGIIDTVFDTETEGLINGGLIGKIIALPFIKLFDKILTVILLSAIAIISILVIFQTHLSLEWKIFGKKIFGGDEDEEEKKEIRDDGKLTITSGTESTGDTNSRPNDNPLPTKEKEDKKKTTTIEKVESFFDTNLLIKERTNFSPLPLSLLERDTGKPVVGDIKANANIIKRTLLNFGIDVEMDEISIGPSITRYSLKPAEGVKLSKIVSLQNDLALALAAHPIRIEAPIPGKSLVGIEIPNSSKSTVGLGTLLSAKRFQESVLPLLIPLGKGVSGIPYFADMAKAPHMLIAGATGSGKSVTIHTIITALLYRNPSEQLRFIMIDPKRVELTLYNGIPHLLTPVITEPKRAILSLRWAAKEMERRYNILEQCAVRDIQSYHQNIYQAAKNNNEEGPLSENMPYIVIVIDELADIMSAYPRELESAIVRLAQMSRAVGIHLILSTQRPSVEIITGLIKANIPSRIALQVPSQIDSRTILDMPGAEKLLGAGDMLYISGETSKPTRIQSGYISENEVKRVVKHLVEKYKEEPPSEINISETRDDTGLNLGDTTLGQSDAALDDDDEMYKEAEDLVTRTGKASASYLQRKLKLGYARAARIMDMLEERGIIGPGEGAKPREVYKKDTSGFGIKNEDSPSDNEEEDALPEDDNEYENT